MVTRAQKEKQEIIDKTTRAAETAKKGAILAKTQLSNELGSIYEGKEYYKRTAKRHYDELEDVRRKLDEKVAELKVQNKESIQKDRLLESNREALAGMENKNRTKEKVSDQTILEPESDSRA